MWGSPTQNPEQPISFVVDQVNMQVGDAMRTTKAAQAYVDRFLREGEMAAVFGIGLGIHVYQQFTSDRASLAKAILAATSGGTRLPGDVSDEICLDLIGDVARQARAS